MKINKVISASNLRAFIALGLLIMSILLFYIFRHQIIHLLKGEPDTPPSVIMILVDALRADSLGCYGYLKNTSPNLDAFAEQNILFESARSQATCTFPSVNSMLTSRYPFYFIKNYKSREHGNFGDLPYLPAILKEHGYTTVAVSSNPIVRNTPSAHNIIGGYGKGFNVFRECEGEDAEVMNEAAFEELEKVSEPFFLFLHYMDPHDRYSPPEEFKRKFCKPYEDKEFIAKGNPNPIHRMLIKRGPDIKITPRDVEHLKDLYDGEIAYFDFQFGILLDRLSELGFLKRSLVVICADHGEEFTEHEYVKHCMTVYETLTHVPLIIKTPSSKQKGSRKALVQNLDILPTILDYSGIDQKQFSFQGKSLRPVIEKDKAINTYSYCVQYTWRSINDGRFKLIFNIKTGSLSLYDLQKDPAETEDIIDNEAETARKLVRALKEWISIEEEGLTREQSMKLSEEVLEKLRALGYFK